MRLNTVCVDGCGKWLKYIENEQKEKQNRLIILMEAKRVLREEGKKQKVYSIKKNGFKLRFNMRKV